MTYALEDHEDTFSIGGRTITNFRFGDDSDGLAEEEEVTKLVKHLGKASVPRRPSWWKKNTSGSNTEIKVNGQKLETVTNFKYLGSVKIDEGSSP